MTKPNTLKAQFGLLWWRSYLSVITDRSDKYGYQIGRVAYDRRRTNRLARRSNENCRFVGVVTPDRW